MDQKSGKENMAVVERWPLVEIQLYVIRIKEMVTQSSMSLNVFLSQKEYILHQSFYIV